MTGRQAALAVALLTVSTTIVAGCGGGRPATPVSPGARRALESKVLDVMDGNGLPLQDDYVGCLPGRNGRSDTCFGLTSDEPVMEVKGAFTTPADPDLWTSSGCPGTLSITVGPPISDLTTNRPQQPLAAVPEDPCR
jgi:hypothetical protein